MKIIEKHVSAGDREIFDLDEFLSRPLYAHLAHASEQGPRESPVWFHWDGQALWIIGGTSFPANLRREPRCAIGIVDWDPATGKSHHVGIRGRAEVLAVRPGGRPDDLPEVLRPRRGAVGPTVPRGHRGGKRRDDGPVHTRDGRLRDQSYKPPWGVTAT